jgi:hypothetical protein
LVKENTKMCSKLLTAILLGLVLMAGTVLPAKAQAACVTAYCWKYAGAYRYYEAACNKAAYLQGCGYHTYIKYQGGWYCVYYC